MSKVSELVYMVTDLVKTMSDDSTINENHIMYLLDIYRAFLLKQRYEKDPKKLIPESNYQSVSVEMEKLEYSHAVDICSGTTCDEVDGVTVCTCTTNNEEILISKSAIPDVMAIGIPRIYLDKGLFNYSFDRVPMSRFEVVGNNKWLSNFIYWTVGPDNKIYMKSSSNKCYKNVDKINILAIFESYRSTSLDMNDEFPIEESLIPNLLELVVKDVLGASLRPKDRDNNASDDLANIAAFIRQNMKDRYVKDTQTTSSNAE
jgi:hypothetical protein